MNIKLKRLQRGFTLVELMIVVAIVGILAALAIYGVTKYVANAKTAEARSALGRIMNDATTAFARERMDGALITAGETVPVSNRLCATSTPVPEDAQPAGEKYQPQPSDWDGDDVTGWRCLRYTMDKPIYFQYTYLSTGEEGNTAGDRFGAIASATLDEEISLVLEGELRGEEGGPVIAVTAPAIRELNSIATALPE